MPTQHPYGSGRKRGPRYVPRDPKRAQYYKASIIAGVVFILLAVMFPFWLDHVRRSQDRSDFEATRDMSLSPEMRTRPRLTPAGRTPAGSLPYGGEINAECQSYVASRCNVLGIRPGVCGTIEGMAMKVPIGSGLSGCREEVDQSLDEAAEVYGMRPAPEGPVSGERAVVGTQPPQATRTTPTLQVGEEGEATNTGQQAVKDTREELPPREKANNLAIIHRLVEELQRASQNYGTLPIAQRARLLELRNRVEADGSPELRSTYNLLLKRHGHQAGFDSAGPGLTASESQRTEVGSREKGAPTTTPELNQVRNMIEEARQNAGMSPATPPTAAQPSPPTSIDPSTVQAPAAVSL